MHATPSPPAGALFPSHRRLPIRLDDRPRYRGSVHDDEVARRMGFRAALVPGAFIYGHMARIAVEAWGEPWLRAGRMGARFRRPVYKDDVLDLAAGPLERGADGVRATISLRDAAGEEVAAGWVGPPEEGEAPADRLAVRPLPEPRPSVGAGQLPIGAPIGSRDAVLTGDDVLESLAVFDEHHPLFRREGFVHPGCLMRLAMFDANESFRFPAPAVLVEVEARHFAAVRPGARIATAGRISADFERRGRHYIETDETLLADGVPAARYRRVQIYASAGG
ncbi:hypothetical protein [Aureimonas jatrophae]|uniref:MaoC like domain-containing protein n=1 Tax=Aureimonas jatrophae TaxID=1166073 RepID=A0A1H0HSJ6_9HYPH|nr:hypothetical protein [Aureimonas jatrophae]MBB3950753.1 hypothetical protein [Aureimonas jatrophae]SDO22113.1 hypothetical protein SAMN05192530_104260 [Aureimonas jatrophae]